MGFSAGIAVDDGGSAYATGGTQGNLDGNINAGGSDIFIVRYNSTGNKQWVQLLGSSSNDCGQGIAVDSIGGIYVTGYTFGDLDGNINAGGYDIFIAKYNGGGRQAVDQTARYEQ